MISVNLHRTINIGLSRSDKWIELAIESGDGALEVSAFFGCFGDTEETKKLMVSNALIDLRNQIDQILEEEA